MSDSILNEIRKAVIGTSNEIEGPFGQRQVCYCDYTASGRSLGFIEDFIRDNVMPYYANTHTESSGTGLQTSRYREDARKIIRNATGCSDEDAVIFCGSGATEAINKLIDIMNLRLPRDLSERYNLMAQIPEDERPVVFIGPYEHHANELPWRESIAKVVVIDEDSDGKPDRRMLVQELERYQKRPLRIGSFSAASNVTGIGTGTVELSQILHKHGALAFWDFAAAAPYVNMEMNPVGEGAHKDAMFMSPHKFIGGPGTPGLLVVKRNLLKNKVPSKPGGGTVSFVDPYGHRYHDDVVRREEGGTPDIIGSIRAGLVFQLKEAVGVDRIRELEDKFIRRAVEAWSKNPKIKILGNPEAWRLSIISFLVRHNDQFLHHNFVVRLLNDLFGLQVRGGCSCAGPYGHRLLGIDVVKSQAYLREVSRGCHGIKPGWTRVNFNYFMDEGEFDYVIKAIDFVATHGVKFLPLYEFNADEGIWLHRDWQPSRKLSLQDVKYVGGTLTFPHRPNSFGKKRYEEHLEHAQRILADIEASPRRVRAVAKSTQDFEELRWFPLPQDVCEVDS